MASSLKSSASVLAVFAGRGGPSGDSYRRADRVFAALSQSIYTGYLAPRTKLPSEAELAHYFRVSRPVVREALKRLRDVELVESVRGSGTYVRLPPEAAAGASTASAGISHILHGVELRLVIEPEAAALAAVRRGRDDLARLGATVEAFARATASGEPTHAHDYGFHESISRATGNPRLLAAIQALEFDVSHAVDVWRQLGRIKTDMRMEDAVDEHRAILECIRQQDAEGARRAMRGHIEQARVRMMARG